MERIRESWTGWHSWKSKSKRHEPAKEGSHARLTSLDDFEMVIDSTLTHDKGKREEKTKRFKTKGNFITLGFAATIIYIG